MRLVARGQGARIQSADGTLPLYSQQERKRTSLTRRGNRRHNGVGQPAIKARVKRLVKRDGWKVKKKGEMGCGGGGKRAGAAEHPSKTSEDRVSR